jgi:hypothetical protein
LDIVATTLNIWNDLWEDVLPGAAAVTFKSIELSAHRASATRVPDPEAEAAGGATRCEDKLVQWNPNTDAADLAYVTCIGASIDRRALGNVR